ncbi:uncharacterized protein LOC110403947 isoform X4 [Numida meleagris]|uniref:uncharacterized protein LOC110403947 isoform X4 n=1 Tax=Numida meleagris TaxID=8996 RepID=UPI000B3E03B9|nr:uncharacterized protein LOC110403947 isoform X4 [Numida meleagris]
MREMASSWWPQAQVHRRGHLVTTFWSPKGSVEETSRRVGTVPPGRAPWSPGWGGLAGSGGAGRNSLSTFLGVGTASDLGSCSLGTVARQGDTEAVSKMDLLEQVAGEPPGRPLYPIPVVPPWGRGTCIVCAECEGKGTWVNGKGVGDPAGQGPTIPPAPVLAAFLDVAGEQLQAGTSGTSPTGIVAKHSKSHLLRTRGPAKVLRMKGGLDAAALQWRVRAAMDMVLEYDAVTCNCIHFALALLGLGQPTGDLTVPALQ